MLFTSLKYMFQGLTVAGLFIRFVKYLDERAKQCNDAIGVASGFAGWFLGKFRSKDRWEYEIGCNTIKIRTLLTGNPTRVTEWCRDFTEDFMDEIERPGSVSVFVPKITNQKKESKVSYLVVFLAADRCLVFKMNVATLIPIHLRNLLEYKNFVFFFDSSSKLKKVISGHCPLDWEVPPNFRSLPNLLQISSKGFDSQKLAFETIENFKYNVPAWMLTSNWEKKGLSYNQVEFLVMKAYSVLMVARQNRHTRWPTPGFFNETSSEGSPKSDGSDDTF